MQMYALLTYQALALTMVDIRLLKDEMKLTQAEAYLLLPVQQSLV